MQLLGDIVVCIFVIQSLFGLICINRDLFFRLWFGKIMKLLFCQDVLVFMLFVVIFIVIKKRVCFELIVSENVRFINLYVYVYISIQINIWLLFSFRKLGFFVSYYSIDRLRKYYVE